VNYVFNNDVKNKNQIGFIAQDVETVYPEVVVTDENGFKSMIYANLVAPIVESIKSLYQSFKALESEQIETQYEMDLLKAENAIIKNENKKIWDELERIKLENEVLREKTEKSEKETADFKTRLERMERILQSH
jgi:predicted nuclease with TOPRIM domain